MHKILFVFFSSLNPMPLRFIEMLNACNRSYVYRKYFAEFELCIVNEFNWMLDGEIFTFLTLLFCMNFFFTSKSLSQFFFQVLINWEITLHTILYSNWGILFRFFFLLSFIESRKKNQHAQFQYNLLKYKNSSHWKRLYKMLQSHWMCHKKMVNNQNFHTPPFVGFKNRKKNFQPYISFIFSHNDKCMHGK